MQSGLEYASLPDHLQHLLSTRSGFHHLSSQFLFGINPVLDASPPLHHQIDTTGSDHELHLLHHFHHGHDQLVHHDDPAAEDSGEQELLQQVEGRRIREDEEEKGGRMNRSAAQEPTNRWPREETLALLKIRSSMEATIHESNFKGPIWEHVSRKLAELGFRRSAKKCKEKFENVTKYYKKTKDGRQDGKNYRFYSELEALYSSSSNYKGGGGGGAPPPFSEAAKVTALSPADHRKSNGDGVASEDETLENVPNSLLADVCIAATRGGGEDMATVITRSKKRKKRRSFEEMKWLLEEMVKQMMQQQEELQRRFLEAVSRRDQERIQREEAWKMQELARLSEETELRSQEHGLVSNREAAIIGFLRKISTENNHNMLGEIEVASFDDQEPSNPDTGSNPRPILEEEEEATNYMVDIDHTAETSGGTAKTVGESPVRRWPRPEVYALIQLRCKHEENFKENNNSKGSVWEKISQDMVQLGYARSAKRCKEKWENINKYFRKTKDAAKVRPPDSKSCPYFHALSSLYQKGVLSFPAASTNAPQISRLQQYAKAVVPPKDMPKNVLADGGAFVDQLDRGGCRGRTECADSSNSDDSGGYGGELMNMCGENVGSGVESQSSLMELVCGKLSSEDYNGV